MVTLTKKKINSSLDGSSSTGCLLFSLHLQSHRAGLPKDFREKWSKISQAEARQDEPFPLLLNHLLRMDAALAGGSRAGALRFASTQPPATTSGAHVSPPAPRNSIFRQISLGCVACGSQGDVTRPQTPAKVFIPCAANAWRCGGARITHGKREILPTRSDLETNCGSSSKPAPYLSPNSS